MTLEHLTEHGPWLVYLLSVVALLGASALGRLIGARRFAAVHTTHRHLVGLFMPLVALVLVVTVGLSSNPALQVYSTPILLVLLIIMLGEGLWISRRVIRKVREEFPDAPDRSFSIGWYAVQRAMTIRKLRSPKAFLKPGDVPVAEKR